MQVHVPSLNSSCLGTEVEIEAAFRNRARCVRGEFRSAHSAKNTNDVISKSQCEVLLLIEEILHHQGCIQPCNGINMVKLFILPINWCRISAINSSTILQIFLVDLWSLGRRSLTSGVDAVFVCRNGGLDVCFTSGVHFNSFHGTFSRLLWYGMVFSERLRCIHRKVERCGTFWMRGFLV